MKSKKNYKLVVFIFALLASINLFAQSTGKGLSYPFYSKSKSGMFLRTPSNIGLKINYNIASNQYFIQNKIGNIDAGRAETFDFEEYQQYSLKKSIKDYWNLKSSTRNPNQNFSLGKVKLFVPGQTFDRIFGGNAVDIRPQGYAELIFGLKINRLNNPQLPEEQRRTTSFDFQEKIQMNVIGKIGDKLKVTANFNTETTFDFENNMKVEYTGYEDEIIKKLEIGNVSLPLNGTLITGSQSLFGFKAQLQFGRTTVTGILSQQKSTKSEIEVSGGAQTSEFDVYADQYEANKHYFLSHYFKDNYDLALSNLPFVNSNINITKVEVWVTNKTGTTNNTRNIVSFLDLGESRKENIYNDLVVKPPLIAWPPQYDGLPIMGSPATTPPYQYASNDLYSTLIGYFPVNQNDSRNINQFTSTLQEPDLANGTDYEKLERARKLTESEFTIHNQLGYISLNQALNNDEVLSVAFQYTIGDQTFQVGELSSTGPNAPDFLIVKLIKGTNFTPILPNWDLMMKNIYAIGAYQMNGDGFMLDVVYENTKESGAITNYIGEGIIEGIPLIKILNLDRLNQQMDVQPDGVFDFIEGITARSANGRIIFPVREPFGSHLFKKINNENLAEKYVYQVLYDSTLTVAQQYPELNKFRMQGTYQSSSGSEIRLNAMNVPEGSVTVTAGSQKLTENQHYTVDYMLGRVNIIDEGILNSGVPIKISLENNSMFGIQNKTLVGLHADYEINKDFMLGATMLNLTERPYTTKINTGEEPISNTIWGLDGSYQTEAPWLTRAVDWLPLIETKVKSRIIATTEFAYLMPGHHRAVGDKGVSYIDDFESSRTSIDIKNMGAWKLASFPINKEQDGAQVFNISEEFIEESENLKYGAKRAKLAWYTIDPLFFRNTSITPPNVNKTITLSNGNSIAQQSYHYSREVLETEVFPNKDPDLGSQITNLAVLDIAYYPNERGPYNYTVSGLDADGKLKNPSKNWGGIMRKLETTDFEASNIEFVEFWMMDPFNEDDGLGVGLHSGGDMYIHLGNISEDVLRDGYKSFENGLPTSSVVSDVETTAWGRVPSNFSIVEAFDNDPASREFQDVGMDGLRNVDEKLFFDSIYIQQIAPVLTSTAYQNIVNDPSADDFHYFRGSDFDSRSESILNRYKDFNNTEGNSVTTENSPESYPTAATSRPNTEDLNNDNTLSETESYFQYKIRLFPEMDIGDSYITDVLETTAKTENGQSRQIKWYQFRVPIYQPDNVVGSIRDFKSIRFMRMSFTDFEQPIICRFATMELVRGEWRRYDFDLKVPGEYIPSDNQDETSFDVSAVNIEENGNRSPIPYVLPPGIEQETDNTTTTLRQQNEQSLVLKVCDLQDGDSRAAYKTAEIDVRAYKRIKMFVHAEAGVKDIVNKSELKDGDLSCFIRLGTDFTSNYYEFEIPLKATSWYTTSASDIWPEENEIDIAFEIFQIAKQERNKIGYDIGIPYVQITSGGKVIVVGNPNLAQVKTIMIGVRNPKKEDVNTSDDGLSKCGQIWVNELRLTDFDEYGGSAANSRLTARLADFGNITLSANMSTVGFGSIEKKLNERQQYNAYQYDLASSFDLGKFFAKDIGIKVPMYLGISESIENPNYNPLDPDILLKSSLNSLDNSFAKDSLRYLVQDYVKRKSINFTNVRKIKTTKKGKKTKAPAVYDIENISLSYSKNETFMRNINVEENRMVNYRGALTYNFNTQPKNIKPFTNFKFPKSPYFRIIKDINFNTMPRSFSFRTDVNRNYNEKQLRNLTSKYNSYPIAPTYSKMFEWNRMYEFKYDLTRTLKLDFAVNSKANIDEPSGALDRSDNFYKQKIDTIWRNVLDFGRPTSYQQTFSMNYQFPLNKIPILNFMSLNTRYNSSYDWSSGPLALRHLGNNIQNSNTKQFNGQINMNTLYNKVPFFKKLNQGNRRRGALSRNRIEEKETDKNDKQSQFMILKHITRFALAVKNIAINYSENRGTFLPGYLNQPHFLGQDWESISPGLPFAFGSQVDIRNYAGKNGWITKDSTLNTLYKTNTSTNITLRSTIEPIRQLRIELTANKTTSLNESEYFRWGNDRFNNYNPIETGGHSISFISLGTAFKRDNGDYESITFSNFRDYREIIARSLAENNPNFNAIVLENGYPAQYYQDTVFAGGYSGTSQDVMIPAFIAAYGSQNPNKSKLTAFPSIPLPNWRLTYDGLARVPFIKKRFKTFSLGHAYRSTYSVGSFTTNLDYGDGNQINFNNMSYHVAREISQVTINEQFSPLFKIDMIWKNSLITKFEIKKSRILALSLANNQITETESNEYVVGTGYRIQDVEFKLRSAGKGKKVSSDLNLKLDLNIRNNKTVIRRVIEDQEQITMGQRTISIKFSADYVFNQRVNIKVFYDRVVTNPFISTTFPGAITNAGFSLRFTLAG